MKSSIKEYYAIQRKVEKRRKELLGQNTGVGWSGSLKTGHFIYHCKARVISNVKVQEFANEECDET